MNKATAFFGFLTGLALLTVVFSYSAALGARLAGGHHVRHS